VLKFRFTFISCNRGYFETHVRREDIYKSSTYKLYLAVNSGRRFKYLPRVILTGYLRSVCSLDIVKQTAALSWGIINNALSGSTDPGQIVVLFRATVFLGFKCAFSCASLLNFTLTLSQVSLQSEIDFLYYA